MIRALLVLLTIMIATSGCASNSSSPDQNSSRTLSGKERLPPPEFLHDLLKDYPQAPTSEALDKINVQLQRYGSWRCEHSPHSHEPGVSHYGLVVFNTGGFSEWGITISWRVFEDSGPDPIKISYSKKPTKTPR
jgi:hypothetical protein